MTIVEIDNQKCHRCSKLKTPVELVNDKTIVSLGGLHTSNSTSQIDPPKCTILENDTIFFDVILQKLFQELFLKDFKCGNCLSVISESIKSTFTV